MYILKYNTVFVSNRVSNIRLTEDFVDPTFKNAFTVVVRGRAAGSA